MMSLGVALLFALLASTGCSGFTSEWKRLAADPAEALPADRITGLWTGTWRSKHNDHSGELLAIIEPAPRLDDKPRADHESLAGPRYRVRFKATWGCCFTSGYAITLTPEQVTPASPSVAPVNGAGEAGKAGGANPARVWRVTAKEHLGWLWGDYIMEGTISPTHFEASYKASIDHGVFELRRPTEDELAAMAEKARRREALSRERERDRRLRSVLRRLRESQARGH